MGRGDPQQGDSRGGVMEQKGIKQIAEQNKGFNVPIIFVLFLFLPNP
jgi:hypothetical protein